MENLKAIFSEETLAKMKEEIGDKEVKLVNLTDGGYVSEDKYRTAVKNLETVNSTISQYEADIEKLKETSTSKGSKEELEAMQSKYEQLKAQHETEMKENMFNSMLDLAIVKSGTIDTVGVKAHVVNHEAYKDLAVVGDKLVGVDEIMNDIKEHNAHYFKAPEGTPEGTGGGITTIPPKKTTRKGGFLDEITRRK